MGISTTYARLVFIRQRDAPHDKRNVPVFYCFLFCDTVDLLAFFLRKCHIREHADVI